MINVHVTDGPFGDGVRVFILNEGPGGRYLHRPGGQPSMQEITEGSADVEPSITLGGEEARALLDSLMRYYHGAEDSRALRRDYEAERKRVDTQADVIADIARSLAAQRTS
ncbi:hypothetical protein [Streptacidiphilus carbonis]|uniref:hypothetical protein n=1 Tax=Streptacidiphilus carbonis TaxID=105422 RepID=UPI0005A83B22|nr:hypothetical protein [Streptacidiphilus carbonis]